MYLSAIQTRQFSDLLNVMSQPGDSATLRQRLVRPVADLLNADYVASLVWDAEAQHFGDGVCCHAETSHLRDYEAHYQFADPIAKLLHPRRYPTLVTQVIAQRELVKSEFFDRFLHTGSMYWGVNLYAHDGQRDVGDLRIWRGRNKQNFDASEIEILRTIYPCLVNSLAGARLASPSTLADSCTGNQWGQGRQLAFKHGLSQRELQVVERVALGCTDKEIAKHLGIAHTTVRTYLSQALGKTGCANRKELIGYFCSAH